MMNRENLTNINSFCEIQIKSCQFFYSQLFVHGACEDEADKI